MNHGKLFEILVAIIAAYCFSGCVSKPRQPIPLSLVHRIQVTTKQSQNSTSLKLTGIYMSSAHAVGKTELVQTDKLLLVRVFSQLASPHTTGVIDLDIEIPNNVDAVSFGNRESIIWRRASIQPTH